MFIIFPCRCNARLEILLQSQKANDKSPHINMIPPLTPDNQGAINHAGVNTHRIWEPWKKMSTNNSIDVQPGTLDAAGSSAGQNPKARSCEQYQWP